jgi:hypothetical protein
MGKRLKKGGAGDSARSASAPEHSEGCHLACLSNVSTGVSRCVVARVAVGNGDGAQEQEPSDWQGCGC